MAIWKLIASVLHLCVCWWVSLPLMPSSFPPASCGLPVGDSRTSRPGREQPGARSFRTCRSGAGVGGAPTECRISRRRFTSKTGTATSVNWAPATIKPLEMRYGRLWCGLYRIKLPAVGESCALAPNKLTLPGSSRITCPYLLSLQVAKDTR